MFGLRVPIQNPNIYIYIYINLKTLDKFWVGLPIYLFLMGMRFPTMGKPSRANLMAQEEVLKYHSKFFSLVLMFCEKA